mgnify:CR=1 FL=1
MAIKRNPIVTPRGKVLLNNKTMKAELVWNSGFGNEWEGRYQNAQKYVDSEVLRLSEPYIPLQTGMLIKSGILGTDIGSGEVSWIAPYARAQYYMKRKPGSETGFLRGPKWFERMKAVSGEGIIRKARRLAGRGK